MGSGGSPEGVGGLVTGGLIEKLTPLGVSPPGGNRGRGVTSQIYASVYLILLQL